MLEMIAPHRSNRSKPPGTHSYKKISSGRQLATQPMINMLSATISEAAPAKKENASSRTSTQQKRKARPVAKAIRPS